ncbi:hypothetical protein [Arthrobacter sp. SDTb3-6]|uniref:hypothetical protein n=1 Tax=Arthrobacter sp. SDTb3-6 TaxID=2713571 RepID=UPI00159DB596|nr:hypothetical protein [Arthrobacter sp. SDTb3-6]NVM97809.1 hypothetical protein [Arthrobacter sp. SDTb3-6]
MALEIEWREPPASLDPKDRLIAALKENPRKWARVKAGMKSGTGHHTWKKLGLEAVSRPNDKDDTLFDVYARFVPAVGKATGKTDVNGVLAREGTTPPPKTGGPYKYRGTDATTTAGTP